MTNDSSRLHAPGVEEVDEGDLDCGRDRMAQEGVVHTRVVCVFSQLVYEARGCQLNYLYRK